MTLLNPQELATLAILANGIIPADETDAGAAAVNAAPRIAEKVQSGINTKIYLQGIDLANQVAREKYRKEISLLSAGEVHELIGVVRERSPGFFKQLRLDVSALYLSDPDVWRRIGFPGPSTASGGYPDFDQPQTEKHTQLKEPHP